jgi:hypothetical protein
MSTTCSTCYIRTPSVSSRRGFSVRGHGGAECKRWRDLHLTASRPATAPKPSVRGRPARRLRHCRSKPMTARRPRVAPRLSTACSTGIVILKMPWLSRVDGGELRQTSHCRTCCMFAAVPALLSSRVQAGPRPRWSLHEPRAKLPCRPRILQGTPSFFVLLVEVPWSDGNQLMRLPLQAERCARARHAEKSMGGRRRRAPACLVRRWLGQTRRRSARADQVVVPVSR